MTSHRPQNKPRRPGFTLMELLVVMAVLIGLALVSFNASRSVLKGAKVAESTSNLRQLIIANGNYQSDYGTYCPADNQYNNRRWHGARRSTRDAFDPTEGFLSPYLGKSMRISKCPLLDDAIDGGGSFENGTGGYGYNSQYIGGRPGGSYDRHKKTRVPARPSHIPDPSRTVMFTTTAYARSEGLQEYAYCEPPRWDFGNGNFGGRPSPSVHFRAKGKALVAWCDGSVTAEAPNEAEGTINPHGGSAGDFPLGWFGPEEANGYWNPDYLSAIQDPTAP